MEVGDVPRVWGEKMRASLGCEPPSDDGRVNCLQDM
jgi:Zn-dependent M32 family carboxypeptidase